MASTTRGGPGIGAVQTVKFVGHDAAGLPIKRKQVSQACLRCRKRKKRCQHVPQATAGGAPASRDDGDNEISGTGHGGGRGGQGQVETGTPDRDTSDAAAQLIRFFHHASDKASASSPDNGQRPPRQMSPPPPFLGDLNPEGILIEATIAPARSSRNGRAEEEHPEHVIGFLPPTSPSQSMVSQARRRRPGSTSSDGAAEERSGTQSSLPGADGSRFTLHVQDASKLEAYARTLVSRVLADKVIPSDAEWQVLKDIYLAKIQPIFPVLEEATITTLPEETGLRELIQATVCLAAATDPGAHGYLSFKSHTKEAASSRVSVTFDEYTAEVADFINRRLSELQRARQISLTRQIQVLALACLYWQPSSPADRFEPLSLYAQLVSIAHTHGIHLGLVPRAQADEAKCDGGTLLKCIYALDRLLGAITSRPFMFHNVDLIRVPTPEPRDPPIFRLFMSLILLLDQVVELYRPQPKISYVDIPVFERMVIEAGAQCEPESLLATLEVLYHAISVLSVRMPRHRFRSAPECDTAACPRTQHLPPSSVNARRSHSADRILDVIRDYKLCPLPFVPYALALSLGVAYRKWRFSQLPMFRTRGGADFKKVLPVLQDMGSIWMSARINGRLGQTVMMKLDRNEIMSRKRAKTAEGSRAKRRQTGEEARETSDKAMAGGLRRVARAGSSQPATSSDAPKECSSTTLGGTTPGGSTAAPDASPSPRTSGEAMQENYEEAPADTSSPPNQPPSLRRSLPSPTTCSSASRPQSMPLTWTATWTADSNTTDSTNCNLAGPAKGNSALYPPQLQPEQQQPQQQQQQQPLPAPSTPERPVPPPGPVYDPYPPALADDAIPLPGDLLVQPQSQSQPLPQPQPPSQSFMLGSASPPLLENSRDGLRRDGNANDADPMAYNDDDALFRSWDPRFAQSVDFSFSSILDPGNPFAWPEYCGYT